MKQIIFLLNPLRSGWVKVFSLLLLAVLVNFTHLKAQNTGKNKRTVLEINIGNPATRDEENYKFYKYYCIVQWELDFWPKILVQGKIDKTTHSFKAVFNLEQNQQVGLFINETPNTIDEICNLNVDKGTFLNLFLESGDSIVINSINGYLNGTCFGKGANNNPYYDYDLKWPEILSNFNDEYINYWLIRLENRYKELKTDLESQKNKISFGFYNYLLTRYKYNYLSQKLDFISKYIENNKDSVNINRIKFFEDITFLEKKIIPELTSRSILNDSMVFIPDYQDFIHRYMLYLLSIKTKKWIPLYYYEPDNNLFKLSREKLSLKNWEYYNAKILMNILGYPDKKESVRPFYEEYIKEFPQGRFTEGLTKAFNSRGDIARGKPAPNIKLKNISGKTVTLNTFIGKKVCLYFYKDKFRIKSFDKILSTFSEMARVYVYTGNDTSIFNENVKSFPGAVHLINPNWASAKEYNVNIHNLGSDATIYIIDKDGSILDFFHYMSPDELEFSIYKIFYKAKEPPKSSTNIKLIIIAVIGMLIIFAGISWLVIRWRARIINIREEKKRKIVEMELRGIRAQMNPHFMFNSLNSIQNLMNQSKVQEANLYLSKFADLMRLVLSNSEKSLIPITDEIEAVRTYCELECLRFDFDYIIDIDGKLDIYNTEIPGMLIQPYVENAILHGINFLEGRKGILNIKLEQTDCLLKCTIDDNGIGRKASEAFKSDKVQKTNGFGLRLAQERLDLLNSQYKQKISVIITDKSNSKGEAMGTLVEICFPLID